MPIFSYLAIPKPGAMQDLCADLAPLSNCEVIPADNKDVVVLVTDTPDEAAEADLQEQLNLIPSLQSLSLAFGCADRENQEI